MDYLHRYYQVEDPDGMWDWMVVRAGGGESRFSSLKLFGDIDMQGNSIINASGGGGGGSYLKTAVIWRPDGTTPEEGVINGNSASLASAIAGMDNLKYIFVDGYGVINVELDLKNKIVMTGFKNSNLGLQDDTEIQIQAGGTIKNPAGLTFLTISSVESNALTFDDSNGNSVCEIKYCRFYSAIHPVQKTFLFNVGSPHSCTVLCEDVSLNFTAGSSSLVKNEGNGVVNFVLSNSVFATTDNAGLFESSAGTFNLNLNDNSTCPRVEQTACVAYSVILAKAKDVVVEDNINPTFVPTALVESVKGGTTVNDNVKYLNILNCYGYGAVSDNTSNNTFLVAEKQEMNVSTGVYDISNTGNSDYSSHVLPPFHVQVNNSVDVLVDVSLDLKVLSNPSSAKLTITFKVDTVVDDAKGKAEVYLLPAGSSHTVNVKFLQKNWLAGGFLGRVYLESNGVCTVAVENAQVVARTVSVP